MNKSITVVIFAAVAITTFAEDQPAAATSPATSSGSFTQSVDYCPAVEKLKKKAFTGRQKVAGSVIANLLILN
ncbi:MAG: hypothetical protein HWD59_04300 [Coxiellaceae bacterium]|nr:MAG: hypothetical protein HWD59_04300 [Coxiellaceae bacterium]